MFRGYNNPRKSDIFGPSATGGTSADARERLLYQQGEGLGSFVTSIFKKIIPMAAKTVKNIAGSKIAKNAGRQLADSAITGLTNVASDVIAGDKTLNESFSDELSNARKEISTAIKKSNRKRARDQPIKTSADKKKRGRTKTALKRKKMRRSVFDDDYD